MATDNGPKRDVTPAAQPSFDRPQPHNDPGPPTHYPPYRPTNEGDPATQYPVTRPGGIKGV